MLYLRIIYLNDITVNLNEVNTDFGVNVKVFELEVEFVECIEGSSDEGVTEIVVKI